jgi:hypothetical protein
MTVVVEFDESLRAADAKEERNPQHQKSNAQIAREQWMTNQ